MFTRLCKIMRVLYTAQQAGADSLTIGQVANLAKLPKTTARDTLLLAEKEGLLQSVFEPYKSTGRWFFRTTSSGQEFALSVRELPLW
jgi:hypothetical protein